MSESPKTRELKKISLFLPSEDNDFINLANDEYFVNFMLEESLSTIQYALDNNLKETYLVEIDNLECKIVIKRKDFKKVLEKIIERYAREENYEQCTKINDLISKI